MSVEALTWAFKQTVGDPISKLLLIGLANHCNDEWVCHPGRKTLAQYAECSTDSIDRRIAKLCADGLLEKQARLTAKGDRTSNSYKLRGVAAVCGQVAANGGGVAAQLCGEGSRTTAATMMNHQIEPSMDLFGDADGNPPDIASSHDTKMHLFDEFWALYPNKVSKKDATNSWVKIDPNKRAEIIAALTSPIKGHAFSSDKSKIPYPTTWLNGERWNDEIIPKNNETTKGPNSRHPQSIHLRQRNPELANSPEPQMATIIDNRHRRNKPVH